MTVESKQKGSGRVFLEEGGMREKAEKGRWVRQRLGTVVMNLPPKKITSVG